jgi:hypothetical protein
MSAAIPNEQATATGSEHHASQVSQVRGIGPSSDLDDV